MTLLDKIRTINKIIQDSAASAIDFENMARAVAECIGANLYVINTQGKLLGYGLDAATSCEVMVEMAKIGNAFPRSYTDSLLAVTETSVNIRRGGNCTFADKECPLGNKYATIVPICGGPRRLGTVVLSKLGEFSEADLILAEYVATVVGVEIMRAEAERLEETARHRVAVAIAIDTLSYSELEAVQNIFHELPEGEGLLVASKIADKVGITRSVIVNALRKLESAGVIEVRSLGMKGTYIKIMNEFLLEELSKVG